MLRTLRKRLPLLIGVLVVVALVVLAMMPTPVPVDIATAQYGPLRMTVDEDGKTRIREKYIVAAPLSGRMARITLKPGDEVRAGITLLASIEPKEPDLLDASARTVAEARVKAADASKRQSTPLLDKAHAAHELAVKDVDRDRAGVLKGTVTPKDYDASLTRERTTWLELKAAQFAAQIAEFELEQAKAALLRTRLPSGEDELWRLDIRSPINGRVLRVLQESATVVNPGISLIEIGDPTDLEVVIDVLSTDAVKIREGTPATLEHWGGEALLNARIRLIEPSGFTKLSALGVEEQRVNVIATITDPPEKWRTLGDAYRVEARIVIWESPKVLKVPAGAVFPHGDGKAVYVVADGKATIRPIRVGHSNGLETEVLEGLEEGTPVIVYPGEKVRDGVMVEAR